jgi:ammonia channel protein AmtB
MTIDTGNTAFMLLCSGLVMLMTEGRLQTFVEEDMQCQTRVRL